MYQSLFLGSSHSGLLKHFDKKLQAACWRNPKQLVCIEALVLKNYFANFNQYKKAPNLVIIEIRETRVSKGATNPPMKDKEVSILRQLLLEVTVLPDRMMKQVAEGAAEEKLLLLVQLPSQKQLLQSQYSKGVRLLSVERMFLLRQIQFLELKPQVSAAQRRCRQAISGSQLLLGFTKVFSVRRLGKRGPLVWMHVGSLSKHLTSTLIYLTYQSTFPPISQTELSGKQSQLLIPHVQNLLYASGIFEKCWGVHSSIVILLQLQIQLRADLLQVCMLQQADILYSLYEQAIPRGFMITIAAMKGSTLVSFWQVERAVSGEVKLIWLCVEAVIVVSWVSCTISQPMSPPSRRIMISVSAPPQRWLTSLAPCSLQNYSQ